MPRIIRTILVNGQYTDDGDWDLDTKAEWPDELNVDEHYGVEPKWTAGDIADAAVEALHELHCAHEYSSYPDWQPYGWYSSEPYKDPYTDYREEKTAHLEGFSEEESRLIHSKIFGS